MSKCGTWVPNSLMSDRSHFKECPERARLEKRVSDLETALHQIAYPETVIGPLREMVGDAKVDAFLESGEMLSWWAKHALDNIGD